MSEKFQFQNSFSTQNEKIVKKFNTQYFQWFGENIHVPETFHEIINCLKIFKGNDLAVYIKNFKNVPTLTQKICTDIKRGSVEMFITASFKD